MDSEPRVERPKAAGTSGQQSRRGATRANRADEQLGQAAERNRSLRPEFCRIPAPRSRLRTNCAAFAASNAEWRSARLARSEPRVQRPKAAGTSGHRSGRRATRMNRADAPLKQTAHSGRRSAERRHPVRAAPNQRCHVRGQERRMALCASCAFRAASGAAEGRGNERPTQWSKGDADESRRCTAEANRSLWPAFCRTPAPCSRLRTNCAAFAASNAEWRSARLARSEPRVQRPKAAGTSGHRSGRRATRMNRADAPLKQTAHSGRRSAERRHPGARLRTNGAPFAARNAEWRSARLARSEPRVERPKAAGTSGQQSRQGAARVNRAEEQLAQTAEANRSLWPAFCRTPAPRRAAPNQWRLGARLRTDGNAPAPANGGATAAAAARSGAPPSATVRRSF